MEITIQKMNKEHLKQILLIEKELFNEPWEANMFNEEIDKHRSWVALDELNQVLGYVTGWLIADQFSLNNIGVSTKFQRKKIATKLMEHVIFKLTQLNCSDIYLEVRKSNKGAIQLYEKFNFIIVGERKNYYQNPAEDALIMKLEIEEE